MNKLFEHFKKSISYKIWLIIFSMNLVLFFIFYTFIFFTVSPSIEKKAFEAIDFAHQYFEKSADTFIVEDNEDRFLDGPFRDVNYLTYSEQRGKILASTTPISNDFFEEVKKNISEQTEKNQKYTFKDADMTYYYSIMKNVSKTGISPNFSVVSFVIDDFTDRAFDNEFFVRIMVFAFLISILPSFILAKFIAKPLLHLKKKVQHLPETNFKEPIVYSRSDEMGQVYGSIEEMRKKIDRSNQLQQVFIQTFSHNLKTPIMVIKSYLSGIRDNIFTVEDNPLDVIDEETCKLEQQVHNLLKISNAEYIKDKVFTFEKIEFESFIKSILHKHLALSDKTFFSETFPIELKVDSQKIDIALENVIENQLRYAESEIRLGFKKIDKFLEISIGNDGPPIPEELIGTLFERFIKGKEGNFGVGLFITERIINQHKGSIEARNIENGVEFIIKLPL